MTPDLTPTCEGSPPPAAGHPDRNGSPGGGPTLLVRRFTSAASYRTWAQNHPGLAAALPTAAAADEVRVFCRAGSWPWLRSDSRTWPLTLKFTDGHLKPTQRAGPPRSGGWAWLVAPTDSVPLVDLVDGGFYRDYSRPENSRLRKYRKLALGLLEKGYTPLPVTCAKKAATGWKQFQTQPPSRDDIYRLFFTDALEAWAAAKAAEHAARTGREDPLAGVGIRGVAVVLGAASAPAGSCLVCRDFDDPRAYDRWRAERPGLAASLPTVQTGRGYHVYFRSPRECFRNLGPEGELRGRSTIYCVVPGSLHPDPARRYRYLRPLPAAGEVPLIDLGESLLWRRYGDEGDPPEVFDEALVGLGNSAETRQTGRDDTPDRGCNTPLRPRPQENSSPDNPQREDSLPQPAGERREVLSECRGSLREAESIREGRRERDGEEQKRGSKQRNHLCDTPTPGPEARCLAGRPAVRTQVAPHPRPRRSPARRGRPEDPAG